MIIFKNNVAFFDNGKKKIKVDSLIPFLFNHVKIEELTVYGLFQYLKKEKGVYSILFRESLGRANLNTLIDQIEKIGSNEVTAIELTWRIFFDDNAVGLNCVNIYPEVYGIENDETMSLTMTPINDLKNSAIIIKSETTVIDRSNNKRTKVKQTNIEWKLFDIIAAILDECTFFSDPKEQMSALAELDQRFAETRYFFK